MPKCAIIGLGQIGKCIVKGMTHLGYEVHGVDPINKADCIFHTSFPDIKFDIVISAAPYDTNLKNAFYALNQKTPYIDLGGDPNTTDAIHKLSKRMDGIVFTDNGLAPGFINILAERVYNELHPTEIKMRVGGLPINPTGLLRYSASWSVNGLHNEYSGEFDIIQNGDIIKVKALDGYEHFIFPQMGDMECFYTQGAISTSLNSMKGRVKNFSYQTIRYPGHHHYINFLLNQLKISKEEFCRTIPNVCPPSKDMVLMSVHTDKGSKFWRIDSNEFSAMQLGTALPTCAIAHLIVEEEIPHKQIITYADVPPRFMQLLQILKLPMMEIY